MFDWLRAKMKVLFSPKATARDYSYINPRRDPLPKVRRSDKLNDWCCRFMARQGGIVPKVSPESIYYRTNHPRRRHA